MTTTTTTNTTTEEPTTPDLDDHDGDEDDENAKNLFGFLISETELAYHADIEITFSSAETALVAPAVLAPKLDELRLGIPPELRGQVSLEVEVEDKTVFFEATILKAVWNAGDDARKSALASQAKLALSQALRACALVIEAHDLFSLGKVSVSTFAASIPTPAADPSKKPS